MRRYTIAQKWHALRYAKSLVLECGSALANAMFLPKGAALTVLCMRDHTSSR